MIPPGRLPGGIVVSTGKGNAMNTPRALNVRLVATYNRYLRFANAAKKADHDVRMRAIRWERSGASIKQLRAEQLQEARDRLARTTVQRDEAWARHLEVADAWAAVSGTDAPETR